MHWLYVYSKVIEYESWTVCAGFTSHHNTYHTVGVLSHRFICITKIKSTEYGRSNNACLNVMTRPEFKYAISQIFVIKLQNRQIIIKWTGEVLILELAQSYLFASIQTTFYLFYVWKEQANTSLVIMTIMPTNTEIIISKPFRDHSNALLQ